jgi:ubiquinone/menaquinone biosynthesis C-methylase UbiE
MAQPVQFDERVAQRLEALYETDDAVRRRRAVLEALRLEPGERVLDIGTGPGFLTLDMAELVGSVGEVVGIDSSDPMLALAGKRCAGKPQVRFEPGDASRLPLPDSHFDAAVSVQVYEYIPEVEIALAEMYRVLRPGGRGAIVSTDWRSIVWNSKDDARMQRVLAAFAEHCPHQDLPRTLAPRLRSVGFSIDREQVLPQFNPTCDPSTFSYHMIGLIRGFARGRSGVTEQEANDWAEDLQRLGKQGRYFFCLNQYLFVVGKPIA